MLFVSVLPSAFVGADTIPYNGFGFVCNASKPDALTSDLEILWYHNGTELTSGDATVTITVEDTDGGVQKISELQKCCATVASSGTYDCIARITVTTTTVVEAMASSTVEIKGERRCQTCSFCN